MVIVVPSLQTPFAVAPFANAIGWISYLALDFSQPVPSGRVQISINPDADSANAYLPPIATASFALGETLVAGVPEVAEIPEQPEIEADPNAEPPVEYRAATPGVPGVPAVPPVTFPTFFEFVADEEFAAAFEVIKTKLYQAILETPRFDGAQLVD